MMKNRKGIIGIELVLLVAVVLIGAVFAAPPIGKAVNGVFGGMNNQQKQTHKITEQYTMFYKDDKGNYKPAPIPYKRTEEGLNYTTAQPPETLLHKFFSLGAIAIIIIVILSYLGIWPVIQLLWNKKVKPKLDQAKAELEAEVVEKQELTADAKLIVISVDAGLKSIKGASDEAIALANAATDPVLKERYTAVAQALITAKEVFLTEMSKKQDKSTKDRVKLLLT